MRVIFFGFQREREECLNKIMHLNVMAVFSEVGAWRRRRRRRRKKKKKKGSRKGRRGKKRRRSLCCFFLLSFL